MPSKEAQRRHYEANKDSVKARARKWAQENPERRREIVRRSDRMRRAIARDGRLTREELHALGRPLYKKKRTDPDTLFWRNVEKTETCWLWTASTSGNGYGQVRRDGKNYRAHRIAYESLVGPVPEGLELDHLCRVRRCVNPGHLEPVTHAENLRRARMVNSH